MEDHVITENRGRAAGVRIVGALVFALVFAGGIYALLEATQPTGLISFTFLLILPAAINALVAYAADPWRERSLSAYLRVPFYVLLLAIVAAIVVAHEGVICVILLAPLWLASGCFGAWATYDLRHKLAARRGRTYCTALIALPLVAMQIEPMIPLPVDKTAVTRSVVVAATPATLWPLLRGIPDVRPGEGRWNLSQDVIGIPRPIGATLVGSGLGADRFANWGENIRFRERVTDWRPGRVLGWRFIFDDIAGWRFTDRHLMPDSAYFTVTTGSYRVEPIDAGHSRLTLTTRYRIQTPVNAYSELWGELFLGDVENNLLALVKGRAEAPRGHGRI